MQRVYAAAHLPEAHLVRGLLDANGIRARIFNEYAPGAAGELPPTVVHPEVWVEDDRDLERARQIVERYERPPASAGSRRCPACGETNPSGFGICWHCQRPL